MEAENLITNMYEENMITGTTLDITQFSERTNNYSDMYTDMSDGCASGITRLIGATLTITRLIFIVLSILCICKGIANLAYNRKINKDKVEENEPQEKSKNKNVSSFFIASAIMVYLSFMINVIRNFAAKPIIYIYPEEETNVKVKVSDPKKLTCTYPKYEDGWEILAKPNGDLIDLKTNRKLYALYWEGINTTKSNFKEGFIVKGEDVAKFLEEKLEVLGLNEREAEEFIVYWLPLMEKNKYNFVRFETLDEINENLKLEITPTPETLIRINMEFKGLSKPIEVEEQKLERRERKGYTVVEWGGTKL